LAEKEKDVEKEEKAQIEHEAYYDVYEAMHLALIIASATSFFIVRFLMSQFFLY